MILVDTSVWADHFNGTATPQALRLLRALGEEEEIGVPPVVVAEVLQGFRHDRAFREARDLLLNLPSLALELPDHVAAAQIYRALRRRGITVRGTVDCLIAQTAIRFGARLLSSDTDFRRIADHFPLRLLPADDSIA